MTPTATAEPSAHTENPIKVVKYDRLLHARVHPSKTNPRTHFDPAYLADLAVSIREKGIIQPIVVRPMAKKPDDVEIVAGECRWRAAGLAGLELVPVIVREYSDEQVLEIQMEENIHRKNLTPLEEAAGYRRLITMNPDKHSAASIAQRIGMSVSYVWDYLKLNDLIPEAKKILERELMTVGHAILIARLKPEDQKRAISTEDADGFGMRRNSGLWRDDHGRLDVMTVDDELAEEKAEKNDKYHGLKTCSVRELETWIRNHVRFDVEHAAKAQPLVFEQIALYVKHASALPGRGKKVIPITLEYRVADDARDECERTYGTESWKRADGKEKSKTCDHSVLGVVVAGRGQGQTLQVCVARDKCVVHFAAVVKAKQQAAKLRDSGKGSTAAKVEKKADDRAARERERAQAREEADRRTWVASVDDLQAAALDKVKALAIGKVVDRLVRRSGMNRALTAVCGKRQPRTADEALRVLLLDEVICRITNAWSFDRSQSRKALKSVGVNVEAILKKHQVQPETPAAPAKKSA